MALSPDAFARILRAEKAVISAKVNNMTITVDSGIERQLALLGVQNRIAASFASEDPNFNAELFKAQARL